MCRMTHAKDISRILRGRTFNIAPALLAEHRKVAAKLVAVAKERKLAQNHGGYSMSCNTLQNIQSFESRVTRRLSASQSHAAAMRDVMLASGAQVRMHTEADSSPSHAALQRNRRMSREKCN